MAENNLQEDGRLVYAKGHIGGVRSGALTGVAANGLVYGLRNIDQGVGVMTEELIVDAIEISFWTETPFTTPQNLAFGIYKATAISAAFTGGNAATNQTLKRRGLLANGLIQDFAPIGAAQVQEMIANTGVIAGGGTIAFTAAEPLGCLVCQSDLSGTTGLCSGSATWYPRNRIPISLGANEGIVVAALVAMGAGGAGRLFVAPDLRLC